MGREGENVGEGSSLFPPVLQRHWIRAEGRGGGLTGLEGKLKMP